MKKSIIGFGDSWIYGDGVAALGDHQKRNRLCVLGQIGNKLGLPVENHGRSGAGIASVQWDFAQWINRTPDPENYLIIIGIPCETRESWWDNDPTSLHQYHESIWLTDSSHKWHDFKKFFLVHSDCNKLQQLRYWQGVNWFDSYAYKKNLSLLQINVFRPEFPVTDVSTLFHPTDNMIDLVRIEQRTTGKILTSECHHANAIGAEWLADIFVKEINKRELI
jgi:hypothetical protein